MMVAGPAMVATGTYAPKGFAPEWTVPQGAQEASGLDGVTRVAREQIGRGADFIKVYADYRWGPERRSAADLHARRAAAHRRGRQQQRPRRSWRTRRRPEGMRRAIEAGVETIEHGDGGTPEIWKLMVERSVGVLPDAGRR